MADSMAGQEPALKRLVAVVTLAALSLATPMYARHSKHQLNPDAKAAQKRARARSKALKKAAKQTEKRNRQLADH